MTNQMTSKHNKTRIRNARQALTHYLQEKGVTPDTVKTDITDLVTDLFHLADYHGIDCERVVFNAREHFRAESSYNSK